MKNIVTAALTRVHRGATASKPRPPVGNRRYRKTTKFQTLAKCQQRAHAAHQTVAKKRRNYRHNALTARL